MNFLSLIPGKIWAALGAALAFVLAILGARATGKAQGRSEARTEALEADQKRSQDIERKADEAREHFVDRHPVDRLRSSGKLRD